MPTIPCPDCRAEVSPDAAACPKCGSPVAQKLSDAKGVSGPQFAADVATGPLGCLGCLGALLAAVTITGFGAAALAATGG